MTENYYGPENNSHRAWALGYFNLGPVQIPPIPPVVGMTDRAGTGQVWYLFWDGEDHLMLSSVLPPACQSRRRWDA